MKPHLRGDNALVSPKLFLGKLRCLLLVEHIPGLRDALLSLCTVDTSSARVDYELADLSPYHAFMYSPVAKIMNAMF